MEGPEASFSLHPGEPLPGEGNSLERVSAVGRLLYLGQAQLAQDGTYTCECSNVAGNSSQDQLLEVHGEPGWDDLNQVEGPRRGGGTKHAGRANRTLQNPSNGRNCGNENNFTCLLRRLAFDEPPLRVSSLQLVTSTREGQRGPKQPPLAQRNQIYLETVGNKAI